MIVCGALRNWKLAPTAAYLAATLMCWQPCTASTDVEARRFPQSHIKKAQWYQFLVETEGKPGAVILNHARETRIVVPQESAIYFFTKQSHPAHPAAVRRAIVSYGNTSYVHTSGYYAGERHAFLAWLQAFAEQDRKLQRDLKHRRPALKSLITRLGMTAR